MYAHINKYVIFWYNYAVCNLKDELLYQDQQKKSNKQIFSHTQTVTNNIL